MKTAAQVIEKFEQDVHKVIRKFWPKLVAGQVLEAGEDRLHDELQKPKADRDLDDPSTYIKAFQACGSKIAAAASLGIPETTFRERLKRAQAGRKRNDDPIGLHSMVEGNRD